MLSDYEKLMNEWDYDENIDLDPKCISSNSNMKVSWKHQSPFCECIHKWKACIKNRTKKNNECPFCTGRNTDYHNSLEYKYPEIAKEFHPTENGNLTAKDFTYASGKIITWICKKALCGCEHVWKGSIYARTRTHDGCPYCSGKKIDYHNSLEYKYPEVTKEFHPIKNGNLTPKDFTGTSNKFVWWICKKSACGCVHEWEAPICNRTFSNNGCPYCIGIYVDYHNSLEYKYPEIAKEFHPIKNGNLTAKDFARASNKLVWWMCKKSECGCVHEWETIIEHRTNANHGCPYCQGSKTDYHNSLEYKYPDVAKEFHTIKNGNLVPKDFTYASHKSVWWLCKNKHEWEAMISHRTKQGTGCPVCNESSKGEKMVASILDALNIYYEREFTFENCRNKKVLPFDFYLQKHNLLIEYDGIQHFEPVKHFGGEERFFECKKNDEIKNKFAENNKIILLRIPYHYSNEKIECEIKKYIPITDKKLTES